MRTDVLLKYLPVCTNLAMHISDTSSFEFQVIFVNGCYKGRSLIRERRKQLSSHQRKTQTSTLQQIGTNISN